MPWPSETDFTGAIQNPDKCFEDPELSGGQVGLKPTGMPLIWSGTFASVYKVTGSRQSFAVRCFSYEVKDQGQRYGELGNYLTTGARPDAFVRFEYLERGIRVRGEWFPVVKMAWVEGSSLDKFVENNLTSPAVLQDMCARWRGANGSLRGLGIAHNDLQHGNVMVQGDDAIRLVDYDGIFLPRFRGETSPELGHPHYQHPLRTVNDYDEQVDNFPALVIYLSLLALMADSGLWQKFYNGKNLLLTKADFANPENSECFSALKNSPDNAVRHLARRLEEFCSVPAGQVPDLESILNDAPAASAPAQTPPSAPAPAAPSPPTGVGSDYRSLLQMGQVVPAPPTIALAAPAAPPSVLCPQCNLANPDELIYCDNERCAAVLHPGGWFCAYCGEGIPVKAKFCPECSERVA